VGWTIGEKARAKEEETKRRKPMNREEMLTFLKNEARGIAAMFGPNCETLVHDMTRPGHPILAIYNGTVTGREVGSTADIFGDIGDYDQTVYAKKDYTNQMVLSRDGRTLKSSTFNVVGEDYHFAFGINMDITSMVRASQVLSELTATSGDLQQTMMQDARSQLEELPRECVSAVGKTPETVKKTDRMRIIRMLYKRRAFTYQKSVAIIAERLNVSRYTVYKYMH
jgi:predicted transcriptional regulator YheO